MSRECFSIEDLPRVAGLLESDPARRHLDSCPRCRALLASCREFLDPAALPAEAGLAEAEDRLAVFLDREVVRAARTSGPKTPRVRGPMLSRIPFVDWLRFRPARYALAVATVVAVFFLVRGGGSPPGAPTREPVLRGGEAAPFRAAAHRLDSGVVEVHWPAFAAADRYELVLLGEDLTPRTKLDAGQDTLIMVGLDQGGGERPPLFYRVAVLRGGDVIKNSPTQPWPRR